MYIRTDIIEARAVLSISRSSGKSVFNTVIIQLLGISNKSIFS